MGVLQGGMKCLKYCTLFFNFIVFWSRLFIHAFFNSSHSPGVDFLLILWQDAWMYLICQFLLLYCSLKDLLFGLFLAGFGGYLLYQLYFYGNRIGDVTRLFPIAVIILGFIIFVVGFLGCCGACYESPCMLITFAAVVAILLCLQIAVAVFAFMYKDELMDFLSKRFEEIFNDPNDPFRRQLEHECCGFKSPDPSCGFNIFKKPCWDVIVEKIESSMNIILATAGALCLLQIAAIIVACCLQSKIRSYATY